MNKLAISLLLLGFLGCADSLSDGSTDDSPHFDLTKLRDGVWAVIARDGRHAGANSGIVNLGGGKSAIFDSSLTPEVGALLKEAADSRLAVTGHQTHTSDRADCLACESCGNKR